MTFYQYFKQYLLFKAYTPVHVTDNHTTATGHNERQTLKANKSITHDCMDTTYENWLEK